MTEFSHLNDQGQARMVDVSAKAMTRRRAVATALVSLNGATLEAIQRQAIAKGEVLAVARIAGIQAAKQTGVLIPLCHPLPLTHAGIDFSYPRSTDEARGLIRITSTVSTEAGTGVEMEALTAVAIAALTVYDMCKGIDSTIRIEEIVLVEKTGGTSRTENE